jgi:hypothetical protein
MGRGLLLAVCVCASGLSLSLSLSTPPPLNPFQHTTHTHDHPHKKGAAANYVETEQLVAAAHGAVVLSSFVQVRGSVPLLWTQSPNIKYKPPTALLAGGATAAAFDAHVGGMLARYGAVTCVNLVNQHGSEGALEAEFRAQCARAVRAGGAKGLRYVAFDFHKECGATSYGRLSVLWAQLQADFEAAGMYEEAGSGAGGGKASPGATQRGVIRTNCVDCLDRTNVVQVC